MLRVIKPGGTLLMFGGTRTYHRLACGVEDAGWILKDCIMYLYGSGFPKATDISKQLDKLNGREFELFHKYFKKMRVKSGLSKTEVDKKCNIKSSCYMWEGDKTDDPRLPIWKYYIILKKLLNLDDRFDGLIKRTEAERKIIDTKETSFLARGTEKGKIKGDMLMAKNKGIGVITNSLPTTPEAKLWNGWKSHGLKPAYEPILVAMKPNEGSYANNALKHGVSGLKGT